MKTRKLLARIRAFFDQGAADSRESQQALREVLEKLKRKERKLRHNLDLERNPEKRSQLEQKILLVHSQRSKGLQLLKEENERDKSG
ncbi:hypothetical protein [Motiliproteus sediminis]|uniref:hypothetical protein n=1 Tax=Motiliproteus sediminis TaxID=1468178 RepID=UPI001AEF4D79|nr:hypothetical protein [Motiliproteus sediminis]